jgi:hypothetical protein
MRRYVTPATVLFVALLFLSSSGRVAADADTDSLRICTLLSTSPDTFPEHLASPADESRQQSQLVVLPACQWEPGSRLRIRFLDGDPQVQARVKAVAVEWAKYADVTFDFGDWRPADIRISFRQDDGSWSYHGRCAPQEPAATMNFGWLTSDTPAVEYSRVVLHEFGHALGMVHEHQSPLGGIRWKKNEVYQYYKRLNWSPAMVDSNIFVKYSVSQTKFSAFDPESIMLYPIDSRLTEDGFGVGLNTELSALDRKFVASWYPRPWGRGHTSSDRVADLNGDGKSDVIQFWNGKSYVWLSNGQGFEASRVWGTGHTATDEIGDFNGDGKADVIQFYGGAANVWLSTGTGFQQYARWSSGHTQRDKLGDFDGDGDTDVVQFYGGFANVWLSNRTGFEPYTRWSTGHTEDDRVGDFNGDGKADIIQFHAGNANVWLSTGTGFQTYTRWSSGHLPSDKLGDFNGDGKTDVIQFHQGASYVWLSQGTSFAAYTRWGRGHTSSDLVADVNGDRKDDVVQLYAGRIYVWLSADSSFMPYTSWASVYHWQTDRVGDFNGDSKMDLLQIEPSTQKSFVRLSTGKEFVTNPE